MIRVAFIDQSFHAKTKSSNFFVELLSEKYYVDIFYVDLYREFLLPDLVQSQYDLIICWQTEFVAPYLLAHKCKVVCIPMYDGCGALPDIYFKYLTGARVVNFTMALHLRCLSLGLDSHYFQYYKPPKPKVKNFCVRTFFFWQRRPEEKIDYNFAKKFLSKSDTIYIHNAPDTVKAEDYTPDLGIISLFDFCSNEKYVSHLNNSNIFICPRLSEGIGMSMLEALSRGMVVIAHDAPSANEYIQDGVDGILLDYNEHSKKFDMTQYDLELISQNAYARASAGYENWKGQRDHLFSIIESTPIPEVRLNKKNYSSNILAIITQNSNNLRGMYEGLIKLNNKFRIYQCKIHYTDRLRIISQYKIFRWIKPIMRPVYKAITKYLRSYS